MKQRANPFSGSRDFIIMFACAISNSLDKSHYDEREKQYLKIIKKYNKQEQNLFPEICKSVTDLDIGRHSQKRKLNITHQSYYFINVLPYDKNMVLIIQIFLLQLPPRELTAHTVMALEENPEQDFLGGIFMELNLGNGSNGQFFTPYHVCDLMAKIAMTESVVQEINEKG